MTFKKDSLGFDQVSVGQDFETNVASGEIDSFQFVHIHGRNNDFGTSVEDVWVYGGIMSWPDTTAALVAWSNSVNDANTITASGTRKIRIEGLLSGFTASSEDLGLNGTSTVTSSTLWKRINKVYALEVGTYGGSTSNQHGTISLTHAGTATGSLMVDSSVTSGETQVGRYTVPAGYDCIITKLSASVNAGKSVNLYVFKRENSSDIVSPYSAKRVIAVFDGLSGFNPINFDHYKLSERTDFWVSVIGAGAGSSISFNADLLLKKRV